MGLGEWLERLRAHRRGQDRAPGFFDARGDDPLPTVGASFCTHEIDEVTGGGAGALELEVFLVRDARNLHDRNAIVVHSRDARRLAYLDRPLAAAYAPALDHIGADALVGATASRLTPSLHWTIMLHVDRALLDELRAQVGRGEEPGGPDGPGIHRRSA